ncbi:hypothetical protein INR49_000473 [Caranx melampygus]|nr:hypothetical protein INR49_000473 [Caranx melampygus]
MPVLLNADASFSSKQELLDLQECGLSGGPSLDTPSPVDSQTDSPIGSGPRSPSSPGADGPIRPPIFTGASTLPGQLYGMEAKPHAEPPIGLKLIATDLDQLCGWGALRPKAIQVFNTPRWVLFFLCVASFLQGMIINGFINTVVTSIERRFDLRSYQAGLIASSYDIAACVCLAFVSYFGGTGHKPRWLGWGVLIMALGSLVFALPHFTTPPYQVSLPEQTGMCSANRTSPCQDKKGGGLSSYRFVFMLGQFLHGVGATPLYTLGVTYLDENVKTNYAPVYIASADWMKSWCRSDSKRGELTEMTPENPLWVGAWWIGFLAGGAAALLVAFPILGYPRQLPGSQEYVAMRVSEAHQLKDGSHTTPQTLSLANQSKTCQGYMVVPAGGGGTFLGGYIVKRLNLRCRGIIRFCMVCAMVSLLAIFIFLIHCPNVPMAGITAPYQSGLMDKHQLDQYKHLYDKPSKLHLRNSSSLEEDLTVGCNAGCSCVRELYNPVCGADGVMYYSPCHAGCSSINHTEHSTGKQVYSGCRCVVGNVSWGEEGFALAGKCGSSCHHMPAFLSFLFIIISFTFLCSIPALTATLRCVPDSQRSFGLGIQWIVVRTLGGIPGPIAFGSVIDISCLLWQDQCGEQGSCYLYQNSAMSQYTLVAGIIYKVLGTIFFLLASILYQPPPESPQSSCESTDHGVGNMSDLPVKDLPEDGVIVNLHARL